MRLYFLRHGIAEDRAPGRSDAERRLTPEGIEQMERVGEGLRALDLDLDAILTSPLVRARETADLAAKALGLKDRLHEEPLLASGARFGDLQQALADAPEKGRIMLVGHEPDLSGFVEVLTGGRVRMEKASVAYVKARVVEPGMGELRWLLEAEQLGRVGE
jgi:phosphohistidine phosphatase